MRGSVRGERSSSGAVLSGPEFRERVVRADGSIDRESFRALWPSLRVMGRCSPQDKYTIVRGELSLSMRQPVHTCMWSFRRFQGFLLPSGCVSDGSGLQAAKRFLRPWRCPFMYTEKGMLVGLSLLCRGHALIMCWNCKAAGSRDVHYEL